ncbi:Protein THYLAKOID FORMATION1, chloroplastic [Linum perenne]
MAALTSVSFSPAIGHSSAEGRSSSSSSLGRSLAFSTCEAFRFRTLASARVRSSSSSSSSGIVIRCMSTTADLPTVAETKLNFLKAYKKPIPSIYNNVLQELIVQQHLIRYKKTYSYDSVFALGFVTVYDKLMEGYPVDEDREIIFQAYIKALQEEPEQYRNDANKLEEWARAQTAASLVEFPSREGEVEGLLKAIAERAAAGKFSYSRFFAVGLFRLLELSNATEPTVLEKNCMQQLCAALNVDKRSVDRDLDVYRNLLSKLVQAKELLKEYVAREKKKREERTTESQKASEAVKNCVAQPNYIG